MLAAWTLPKGDLYVIFKKKENIGKGIKKSVPMYSSVIVREKETTPGCSKTYDEKVLENHFKDVQLSQSLCMQGKVLHNLSLSQTK